MSISPPRPPSEAGAELVPEILLDNKGELELRGKVYVGCPTKNLWEHMGPMFRGFPSGFPADLVFRFSFFGGGTVVFGKGGT